MAKPAITPPPTVSAIGAIPLSTTFAGAPSCANNQLSMVGMLQNEVWLNEPFPASGLTSTDCYPTEILASLASASTTLLPAFSPLICPGWYTTVTHWSDNYIACCPSSYTLHLNGNTGANAARTAYNATCFSTLTLTTSVTAYDSVSITSTQGYFDPTAQAYAHAIDGFAPQTAQGAPLTFIGGPGPTLPTSSNAGASQTPFSVIPSSTEAGSTAAPQSTSSNSISTAAIAGIVVGGFAFCLLITLLAWVIYLLHRRRRVEDPYGEGSGRGSLYPNSRSLVSAPSMSQRSASARSRSTGMQHTGRSARSARSGRSQRTAGSRIEATRSKGAASTEDTASSIVDLGPTSPTSTHVAQSPTTPNGTRLHPPRFSSVVATARPHQQQPAEIGVGIQRHELADNAAPWMLARQKEQSRPSRAVVELPGDKGWR